MSVIEVDRGRAAERRMLISRRKHKRNLSYSEGISKLIKTRSKPEEEIIFVK